MTFAEYSIKNPSEAIILIEIVVNGTTYGYCKKDLTPVGSSTFYEGRLLSLFDIGFERDPLTWGKMMFPTGSITLNNGDGYFDTVAKDDWFKGYFGSSVAIKIGYPLLDISSYVTLWTGYVENISHSQESITLSLKDTRSKLDVDIQASWINKNALTVIKEAIILAYPDVTYTTDFFDTTAWGIAQAVAPNVTVDMIDPDKCTSVIDAVSASIFGLFFMTAENKYSYKIPNLDATCTSTVFTHDILNIPEVSYNPTEIVSSVLVYCDIDMSFSTREYCSVVEDTTRKAYVYSAYSIYNSKEFFTYLPDATAASVFATQFLDYTCDIHGVFDIEVPMKYYTLDIGDTTFVELYRSGATEYLGTIKCEVIGKTYLLESAFIRFRMRQWYDEA